MYLLNTFLYIGFNGAVVMSVLKTDLVLFRSQYEITGKNYAQSEFEIFKVFFSKFFKNLGRNILCCCAQ